MFNFLCSYISYINNFTVIPPFSIFQVSLTYLHVFRKPIFHLVLTFFITILWFGITLNKYIVAYVIRAFFLNIYIVNLITDPMYFKHKFHTQVLFRDKKKQKLFFYPVLFALSVFTIIYLSSNVFNEFIYKNPITYSR